MSDMSDSLMDTTRESARDVIAENLRTWGLQDLDSFVYDMIFTQGIVDTTVIRGEIRRTDVYKERFKANDERRRRGLPALDEATYLNMENQLRNVMRDMGMPPGFYDTNEDLDQFIGLDVSSDELQARIESGYKAVTEADPDVVGAMRNLYGVGEGDLAAYFLDPERAQDILLRQAQAAQVATQAQRQANIVLDVATAERLAAQGIDARAAQQGFGAIGELQEVFQTTTEEQMAGEQAFSQAEQIGAVFGTSAAAQQRLRQRARSRQAAFEGGGRFAGQGAEITGLR
jgi:hypothetical protein